MTRGLAFLSFLDSTRNRFELAVFASAVLAHAIYRGFEDGYARVWWLAIMITVSTVLAFFVSYLRLVWKCLWDRPVLQPARNRLQSALRREGPTSPVDAVWPAAIGIVALPLPVILSSIPFGDFSLLSQAFGVAGMAVACLALSTLEVLSSPLPEDQVKLDADLKFVHTALLGANQLLLVTGITAGVTALVLVEQPGTTVSQEQEIWGLVGGAMLLLGAYMLVVGRYVERAFQIRDLLKK